jgi:F-type H+-transporting ATPase subunit b
MHIDWTTLALQTVNVLVLVWLLGRFLFRPVLSMIDERRAAADKLLADAAASRAQAEAGAAELKTRLSAVSADADRLLIEARVRAENERTRMLALETEAVAHLRQEAKAAIEIDRAAMERTLRQQACDLAVVIARRLVARIPAGTVTSALLESLAAAVAQVPEPSRRDLNAGGRVEIVTAAALDENQQMECRTMIGPLGGKTNLVFRTEPALIAGAELHAPGMLIRDSWQADLERIGKELNQEERHDAGSEHLV